jgi:hypothetical protein
MLPPEEVAMGFLDKLLGRDKPAEPEVDPFVGDDRPVDSAESPVGEAEERATEARDETLGIENRVPPGTG